MRLLDVRNLGRQRYADTLTLQRELRLARIDGREPNDILLLVEHEPVYTLGRGTRDSSLPVATEHLRALDADVVEIERGGDVTWHGPGQLVGYPILDLKQHREDLHWYLRTIEIAIIETLEKLGIVASTSTGRTGVWTNERKIASVGIHVKQWVTLHGFALNIDPDLTWFDQIVPCGLDGVEMTSVSRELGHPNRPTLWLDTCSALINAFASAFGLEPKVSETKLLQIR
jgi:lipoate-protein ligase B